MSERQGWGRDPTYEMDKINANPAWKLAWVISEIENDNAPIGWGQYIFLAETLMRHFKIEPLTPE